MANSLFFPAVPPPLTAGIPSDICRVWSAKSSESTADTLICSRSRSVRYPPVSNPPDNAVQCSTGIAAYARGQCFPDGFGGCGFPDRFAGTGIAALKGLSHMSAQAVGGAVGHNEISIIVPCHRVVGTNGSLTGYAGGIDKKVKLLTLENTDMRTFFIPVKGTAL